MAQERTLISFDWAAKTVLRDPANFGILSGFLSELLNKDVAVQEILESESYKDTELEGTNRVDMKVKINNAEIVVVEIQFEHEADFLHRTLFGVSKAVTSQHRKGENFNDIKKVYSIGIVYFNCYYEVDNIGDLYPEYYLIEVGKFDETIRSKFDEWIYFLKTDEVKKGFSARGLAEAKEKLDFLKLSLEEQTEYDRKMNRRSSFNSVMKTARMEGRFEGEAYGFEIGMLEGGAQGEARGFEKGKLEGEAHGKMEMARKMKSEGISIDIISKVTGLPKNEI